MTNTVITEEKLVKSKDTGLEVVNMHVHLTLSTLGRRRWGSLGTYSDACNFSTQEAEAQGTPGVSGQAILYRAQREEVKEKQREKGGERERGIQTHPQLHKEFETSLGYVGPYLSLYYS